jgi:O-antigen/teichoic acid export membrane protein
MSLGSQLVFSYLEKYLAVIIAAAASIVISRYLGPEDVGVFSVCMAMVGLIAVIREFRTDLYVLRLPEPDKASVRAVFTFVAGAGIMLGLGIMLIADALSRFYDDPRIASILAILGLSFMVTPLGSVSQSLLQRGQRFDVLAKVRVVHAVTAGGVSVVLAMQGFGPESMAYGILAAAALNAILSYAASPHSLLPALPWRDFRAIIRSGWPQTATALVDEVAVASPTSCWGGWTTFAMRACSVVPAGS